MHGKLHCKNRNIILTLFELHELLCCYSGNSNRVKIIFQFIQCIVLLYQNSLVISYILKLCCNFTIIIRFTTSMYEIMDIL